MATPTLEDHIECVENTQFNYSGEWWKTWHQTRSRCSGGSLDLEINEDRAACDEQSTPGQAWNNSKEESLQRKKRVV